MSKEQSRCSFDISNIRVTKIQDVPFFDIPKITAREELLYSFYDTQMYEQNLDMRFEDNHYVFLVDIENINIK